MRDFEYCNPTRIIFGKTAENSLLYELRKFGKRVLLVYGGGSIKKSGLYDIVCTSLREAGCSYTELSGVQPNPRMSLVKKGVNIAINNDIDFILAVGGGSVIDTAKAIAVGAVDQRPLEDLFMAGATVNNAIPIGVVLTIPAAGSESSSGCVITLEETGFKRSIRGNALIPKFAIMNPERTYTLPPHQTACGISDIVAHMLERYFTPTPQVEFTDRLIEAGIKTMLIYGPKVMQSPTDYDARCQVMWCGTVAHNNLLSTGRLGDWGSHDIEHQLSALNDVAHGEGLAIIFPAWMKYCYKIDPQRFVNLATRVFDVNPEDKTQEQIIFEMITMLENFYKSLGLRTTMTQIGITEKHINGIADKITYGIDTLGNFGKLTRSNIVDILKLAL